MRHALDEICQSTNHDSVLQNVNECLESERRYKFKDDKTMDISSRLREEITVRRLSNESVLFNRDNMLIIPKELQKR